MKKILLLTLALTILIGASVFANGSKDTASNEKSGYTIGTVVKVDGIAWFDRMREGVKKFGEDTGNDVWLVGPATADAAQQVQLIEDMIAQGVDAICVVPFNVESVEPALKKARDAGIVVICHEASSIVNADYDIEAFDNKAYGAHLMDVLAEKMNYKGEYATFVGSLTSLSHNEWIDGGHERQLEKYPDMKLVSEKNETYDDQNKAYEKMKEVMAAFPNLAGTQSCAMSTAPGIGLAVEEAGLQDKIAVVGTSLVSVNEEFLKSGAVDMVGFWDPADAGYIMNKIAVEVLEGRKITNGEDLGVKGYNNILVSPDKANLLYGSAWVNATKENMADYPF